MARNLARIPTINSVVDVEMLRAELNQRLSEINNVMSEIEAETNQQKGNDGAEPVFNAAPNLRQNRIRNGERSKDPRDFVIRQELIDLGLLGDPSGKIVFSGEVEFAGQTVVSGPSGGSGIATGGNIADAVDDALEANVATSNDGDRLVEEQADGTNGTTPGTTVLGIGPDGKARYIPLTQAGLRVDMSTVETLLAILIDEIQGLRDELGS